MISQKWTHQHWQYHFAFPPFETMKCIGFAWFASWNLADLPNQPPTSEYGKSQSRNIGGLIGSREPYNRHRSTCIYSDPQRRRSQPYQESSGGQNWFHYCFSQCQKWRWTFAQEPSLSEEKSLETSGSWFPCSSKSGTANGQRNPSTMPLGNAEDNGVFFIKVDEHVIREYNVIVNADNAIREWISIYNLYRYRDSLTAMFWPVVFREYSIVNGMGWWRSKRTFVRNPRLRLGLRYRVRLWPIRIYLNPIFKFFAGFPTLIRLYIRVLNLDFKEYKL